MAILRRNETKNNDTWCFKCGELERMRFFVRKFEKDWSNKMLETKKYFWK